MNKIPSEKYLIKSRNITWWDEWLFYIVLTSLLALHVHASWPLWPFATAAIWGVVCMIISYKRQWALEDKRFGKIDIWRRKNGE